MSKRPCTSRADWRLQPGKPAEPLSPHYRLDCDYGTAVITCWEKGGTEPIYVCESHAKALGPPRQPSLDIRIVTPYSDNGGNGKKTENPAPAPEVAEVKLVSPAPLEPAPRFADPAPAEERAPAPQAKVAAEAERSAPPETATILAQAQPAEVCASAPDAAAAQPEAAAALPDVSLPSEPVPSLADTKAEEDRTPTPEFVEVKPESTASPELAPRLPEARIRRALADSSPRPLARDLTYGNSAKAIVDESIWNMPPGDLQAYRTARQQGKSAADASQAAGGQLAVIHRKIGECTPQLEAALSPSKAVISLEEAIDKPLEQSVLEIIGNGAMSDSEKDAAVQQLGAIQQWVKQGMKGNISLL